MPLIATRGAASAQGFGEFAQSAAPNYIEQMFSTYLYTGNGSTQTIDNGIDLAGKGGLVWFKPRNTANNHNLIDSSRGLNKFLITNSTAAEGTTGVGYGVASFNSNGFSLNPPWTSSTNTTDTTQVAWTFREQPKFFDVVTWTGQSSTQTVSHSLGSAPGCIIAKRTDSAGVWFVWHNGLPNPAQSYIILNTAEGYLNSAGLWGNTAPTSTGFTVGSGSVLDEPGATYVAYLFAHDAGGFGLSGNENVVSCGSYTGNGAADGPTVTLGYEPQWLMVKCSSDPYSWVVFDNMRGMDYTGSPRLFPDLSGAESAMSPGVVPTATGFKINTTNATVNDGAGVTYIYIAIRRGPMKVPTLGTSVFIPVAVTPSGSQSTVTTNFPTDLIITTERSHALTGQTFVSDRLRGTTTASRVYLATNNTNAEQVGGSTGFGLDSNVAIFDNFYPGAGITNPVIYWNFRRAPSFFDEVCYTGTGVARTIAHNLAAVPELMIVKGRTIAEQWSVYSTGTSSPANKALVLNLTDAENVGSVGYWNNTNPTSSVINLGNNAEVNFSGSTYVAYLFATAPGVSKVGSYTGTGTTQAINCGFTTGARFVMIKRTDAAGAWYVWDSARGIVAGNDPYLLLNSTAAEVTNTDYIDTSAAGFEITSTAPAQINAVGGSYIFLAVA